MNQVLTGKFITQKRKEKNLTQAQLAEKLAISNKTVSKWENGKCMPDYSIIENLCKELGITIAELMDGEDADKDSIRVYDDMQIMELLRRTQELERQKNTLVGVILITMGMAMLALSEVIGGSTVRDFISGMFLGMSIGVMLIGVCVAAYNWHKQ